jgi:hypothetical protein
MSSNPHVAKSPKCTMVGLNSGLTALEAVKSPELAYPYASVGISQPSGLSNPQRTKRSDILGIWRHGGGSAEAASLPRRPRIYSSRSGGGGFLFFFRLPLRFFDSTRLRFCEAGTLVGRRGFGR